MSRNRDNERGATLVEFGIIAPVLLMLILGIIQFGLLLNQVQGLHAAAREGARVASISSATTNEINTAINGSLSGVTGGAPVVSITPAVGNDDAPCDGREGETVEVILESTYTLDIPFFTGTEIDIAGQGVFRCEG